MYLPLCVTFFLFCLSFSLFFIRSFFKSLKLVIICAQSYPLQNVSQAHFFWSQENCIWQVCVFNSFLVFSPIPDLRLQLLDGENNADLIKSLYGLLMLLPQSEAFKLLRYRLECIPQFHFSSALNVGWVWPWYHESLRTWAPLHVIYSIKRALSVCPSDFSTLKTPVFIWASLPEICQDMYHCYGIFVRTFSSKSLSEYGSYMQISAWACFPLARVLWNGQAWLLFFHLECGPASWFIVMEYMHLKSFRELFQFRSEVKTFVKYFTKS